MKSLSLPGTYHEKISSLGTSLSGFTRLKSLDLSRNALISTEVNIFLLPITSYLTIGNESSPKSLVTVEC